MSQITRVVYALLLGLVALTTAGWAGSTLSAATNISPGERAGVQALLMSGIVLPGIWWLRRRLDRRSLDGLAILGVRRSLTAFGVGVAFILVPALLTVLCTWAFGWAVVTLNPVRGTVAAAIATALFYEALPEEMLFRGYIYRSLNGTMRRWTAGLLTTVLFAALPMVATTIQQTLLGMDVQIGNARQLTLSYAVTLLLFGAVQQYLRILTASPWACVGFHLVFLLSNRLVGVRESAVIRFSAVTSEGPLQAVFIGSTFVLVAAALLYPRISGRSLELSRVDPE